MRSGGSGTSDRESLPIGIGKLARPLVAAGATRFFLILLVIVKAVLSRAYVSRYLLQVGLALVGGQLPESVQRANSNWSGLALYTVEAFLESGRYYVR